MERDSATYRWVDGSTYVKNPPYFDGITMEPAPIADIKGARILAELKTRSPPTISVRRVLGRAARANRARHARRTRTGTDALDEFGESVGELLVCVVDAIVAIAESDSEGGDGSASSTSSHEREQRHQQRLDLHDDVFHVMARELNLHLANLLEPARAVRASLPEASRAALQQHFGYDWQRPLAYIDAQRVSRDVRALATLVAVCVVLVGLQHSAGVAAAFVSSGTASRLLSLLVLRDERDDDVGDALDARVALRVGVVACVGRVLRLAATSDVYQACSENVECAGRARERARMAHWCDRAHSCCCRHC